MLRRSLVAFALLFTWAWVAQAQTYPVPEQQILGAEKPIPLGELVDLSVSEVKSPHTDYAGSSYAWKVLDLPSGKEKRVRVSPDEKSVFFGAGIKAKTLKAFVAVTHLYVKKKGDQVEKISTQTVILTADVVIGEGPPDPAPPTPGPGPEPVVFPDGQYRLARFVYDQARATVPAPGRQKAAAALAESFRAVVYSINAGAITTPEKVLVVTKDANDNALNKNGGTATWESFSEALQDKLFELYQSGKMKTLDQFKTAWEEIATGLEKVS